MRYFSYNEVGEGVVTVSEDDIRKYYWPYWYNRMCEKYGQKYVDDIYSFKECLDDWMVINWAWEVESDNL
jgi:hypothetical protein